MVVADVFEEFDPARVWHIKIAHNTIDCVTVIGEVFETLVGAGRSTDLELVTLSVEELRHQLSKTGVVVHMENVDGANHVLSL
nr:hypothetical protein [Haloplanus sp. HW8-1]